MDTDIVKPCLAVIDEDERDRDTVSYNPNGIDPESKKSTSHHIYNVFSSETKYPGELKFVYYKDFALSVLVELETIGLDKIPRQN